MRKAIICKSVRLVGVACVRNTREGPRGHVPFFSCDLPASLEDIESQCQVMSICQDVFFERPVLQRFSTAVRDILGRVASCCCKSHG